MQICIYLGIYERDVPTLGEHQNAVDAVRQFDRTLLALWDKTPDDAQRIVEFLKQLAALRYRSIPG